MNTVGRWIFTCKYADSDYISVDTSNTKEVAEESRRRILESNKIYENRPMLVSHVYFASFILPEETAP
jgi:hypothetical protein